MPTEEDYDKAHEKKEAFITEFRNLVRRYLPEGIGTNEMQEWLHPQLQDCTSTFCGYNWDAEHEPRTPKFLWNELLAKFDERARAQGWRPGSVKYLDGRMNYLIGAIQLSELLELGTFKPSPMLLLVSVGRPTKDLLLK